MAAEKIVKDRYQKNKQCLFTSGNVCCFISNYYSFLAAIYSTLYSTAFVLSLKINHNWKTLKILLKTLEAQLQSRCSSHILHCFLLLKTRNPDNRDLRSFNFHSSPHSNYVELFLCYL